ncbi:MAG: cobyric acid synthase, partial [Solirubrobacteraceae bacterium]
FAPGKRVGCVHTRFEALPAPWEALSGLPAHGYEIRHGSSRAVERNGSPAKALPDGLGFVDGPVLGVYPHGLLEDPAIVQALLGTAPYRSVEQAIDELADAVLPHLDLDAITAMAGVG